MPRRYPLAALRTDRSGVVGILFALALPMLAGFTALGIEVGIWYLDRRELQTAADAAAVSAAFEGLRQSDADEITAAARLEVVKHGFDPAVGTFQVNNPPSTGTHTDDVDAIEVVLAQPRALMLARLFMNDDILLSARAVAVPNPSGTACVLSLDPTAAGALIAAGNGSAVMPGCIVAANSNHEQAIQLNGSGTFDVQTLSTPGGFARLGSGSTLITTEAIRTGTVPLADPYDDLTAPAVTSSSCDHQNYSAGNGHSVEQLSGGTYCNGMRFGAQATVNFAPGTYVIAAGTFDVRGGATLTCQSCSGSAGVTFILTGLSGQYADVQINAGTNMDLRAPNSGSYSGILFFQDRNAPSGVVNRFNGNAAMNLHGALYFPSQKVSFSGNSSNSATACTQIVASTVEFTGNSSLGSNCANSGIREINAGGTVRLVE